MDAVYLRVCQALTGGAGLAADDHNDAGAAAVFCGDVSAEERRRRADRLLQLLRAVAGKWSGSRDELLRAGRDVTAALRAMPRTKPAPLNEELLKKAAGQLAAIYDAEYGGLRQRAEVPLGA